MERITKMKNWKCNECKVEFCKLETNSIVKPTFCPFYGEEQEFSWKEILEDKK